MVDIPISAGRFPIREGMVAIEFYTWGLLGRPIQPIAVLFCACTERSAFHRQLQRPRREWIVVCRMSSVYVCSLRPTSLLFFSQMAGPNTRNTSKRGDDYGENTLLVEMPSGYSLIFPRVLFWGLP